MKRETLILLLISVLVGLQSWTLVETVKNGKDIAVLQAIQEGKQHEK